MAPYSIPVVVMVLLPTFTPRVKLPAPLVFSTTFCTSAVPAEPSCWCVWMNAPFSLIIPMRPMSWPARLPANSTR